MKSAFGCFVLTNLSGTEVMGGSHVMSENDSEKFTPEKIIECLNDLVSMIGPGDYKVALKKTPKTQAAGEVTYRFFVPSQSGEQKPQQTQGMGYTPQDIDAKITAAVTEALTRQHELYKRDREIEDLKKELKETKKSKKGDYDEAIKQGADLLKMGFAGWLVKEVPGSAGIINGIVNGEVEEEDKEEKEITVKRTD